MIKYFLIPIVFVLIFVFGVSFYFQIDDLSSCNDTPVTSGNCQAVDVIVAISGGDTAARANTAVELYKNGWAKTLVFSGAAQDKSGPSNAAAMKTIAVAAGVPEASILLDEDSATTKQNAENTMRIFTKNKITSIILVTSGYHQRRASLEFNKHTEGITIINHPTPNDVDWSFWWWVSPRGWWLATNEFAKIFVFYVQGIWS